MTIAVDVEHFVNDDDAYLHWVVAHPHGLVVNSYKDPSPSYMCVHRATCAHIRTDTNTNWTTTDYSKTCSESASALATWAKEKFGGDLEPCKICKPDLT